MKQSLLSTSSSSDFAVTENDTYCSFCGTFIGNKLLHNDVCDWCGESMSGIVECDSHKTRDTMWTTSSIRSIYQPKSPQVYLFYILAHYILEHCILHR